MNAASHNEVTAQGRAEIVTRDPRWQSMVARDAAADGKFFYSVKTTGVYCRPSCAARMARPENVAFHATCAAAERAGFRPCRRCKPDALPGVKPPADRIGGANAAIRFAVGKCSLGSILVAESERGICSILMGDDADALVCDLRDRFPHARLIGADKAFEQRIEQVAAFVEAPAIGLDFPLDIRGTAFQQKVWQALREIPAGATASYGEIAARIGAPRAVRAVAQACAANSLAVVIPCHRVVRNDGDLSGYRWGVERKRSLLAREARA
jgi:AraC family transcriptional regulator of adaptative response/methylated-DNA-[protein]-cysteine methyltransferase